MKRENLLRNILLFTIITMNSYAGVSVFKVPGNVFLSEHRFAGDFIWYGLPASRVQPVSRVARLHVPSNKSKVFELNGFNKKDLLSALEAPDSNHCTVLDKSGDLAHFNGTAWAYIYNRSIRSIGSTKKGRIFMNSSDYFGYIENDSVKMILRDSIGLSDYPILSVVADSAENIYVMNRHKITKHDGLTWTVIFHNDSIVLDWIGVLPDNCLYFHWLDRKIDHFLKMTNVDTVRYTLSEMDSIQKQFNWVPVDASGNIWNFKFRNGEFSLEMINGDDTTNSSNALTRGWKNWPELTNIDSRLCKTSGKHVYLEIDNGLYHYDGGLDRTWKWIPLCQTFDALDTIGARTLYQAVDSTIYLHCINGLHSYKNGKFYTFPRIETYTTCVDREGVLWAAIGEYLCRYEEPFYKKVVHIPNIRQIIEDNTGRILVLTEKVLTYETQIFREAGTEWELINQSNSNMPVGARGVKILQAPDGAYWLCTFGESVAKSKDLHNWTIFDTINSILPSNTANDMIFDFDGNVIVSFLDSNYKPVGIFKYTGNKWSNFGIPATKIISDLNVDRYGKVWYGMAYHDGTTWNIVDDELTLNDFIIDYSGVLWAATNDKIYLTTNDEFYKFRAESGIAKPIENITYNNISLHCISGITTTINYTIYKPANMTIAIYSLQGKLVTTLKKGYLNSGTYSTVWNNGGARGLYVLRFSSPGFTYNVPIKNL